jgi:hypothetical protein
LRHIKEMMMIVALSLPLNNLSAADRPIAASDADQVHFIELFSSESCSSCPPADQWVSGLKNNAQLWKSFIPVVFHVDYWNYLDWKDGFSEHEMTQRQIDITNLWPNPSVYTPGVIVDGKEWKEWRSKTLPNLQNKTSIKLSVSEIGEFSYRVVTKLASGTTTGYRIRAALLGFGLESNVTSGENKGKKLMHDFLVLQWQSQGLKADFKNQFTFKRPNQKYSKLAVVAWIEAVNNPTALQAVGGYL